MKRPPANDSPEAIRLREAATAWANNPGRGLGDTTDPEDTIGQRANAALLRAAIEYGRAADREEWLGPISHVLGIPVKALDAFVTRYRREHGTTAGRPSTDLDPALVAVALKGRSQREAAKMLGVSESTLRGWLAREGTA